MGMGIGTILCYPIGMRMRQKFDTRWVWVWKYELFFCTRI